MPANQPASLVLPISCTIFFRLVLNTARRFAYPFAPALSRGLNVPLSSITSLIAVNQITAVLGACIGPLSDRLGYRRMMVTGLALLGIGMLAAAMLPIYHMVVVALFLAGLGKSIYDPALQAWVSMRVPYQRRAAVIGILEISWAASTLIGIPLIAVLMNRYGWRSPFLVMGVLGCVGSLVIYWVTPKVTISQPAETKGLRYFNGFGRLAASKPALGVLGYAFFVSAANDNLFVVYGAWLESSFGFGILALGLGTSIIGVAELTGEALTAAASDRIGLKRGVIIGLGLSTCSYLMLPFLNHSMPLAMGGLATLFLFFEFMMVTSFSLSTELLPLNRATMMAGFFAAAGIGRVVGALSGGIVWQAGGIVATALVSGGLSILGLICLLIGLSGWRHGGA
jgi:DHA1 family inner membrane transport protein